MHVYEYIIYSYQSACINQGMYIYTYGASECKYVHIYIYTLYVCIYTHI